MIGFFLFIMTVVLGAVGLAWGLRLIGVIAPDRPLPQDGIGRAELERVQDALAALDVRLDRLEDQQRFLERLLAERGEKPALPPSRAGDDPADDRDGEASGEGGAGQSILFDTRPEGG